MYALLERMAGFVARSLALAGGMVLIAVVVMTCASIIGRALIPLGLSPIRGDFEWVEIGTGFAVFSFLPWCVLQRGHATVDLFKPAFPPVLNRALDVVVDIAMLAAAILIAWRLHLGMLDKARFMETTFIIQVPVWKAYAAGLVGAYGFVFVAGFCVLRSARSLLWPAKGWTHVQP